MRRKNRNLFEPLESRTLFATTSLLGPITPQSLSATAAAPAIYNANNNSIITISNVRLATPTAFDAPSAKLFSPLTRLTATSEFNTVNVRPSAYTAFSLDMDGLKAQLSLAPREFTPAAANPLRISIPGPDGKYQRFDVVESPLMSDELYAATPTTKIFVGQGVDDKTATIRFDYTVLGLSAQVLSPNGAWYIDPYFHLNTTSYVSYKRTDLVALPSQLHFNEIAPIEIEGVSDAAPTANRSTGTPGTTFGTAVQLRTYRTVVSTTYEYGLKFTSGITDNAAKTAAIEASVTNAIVRVTGIYETDLSVRLNLVKTFSFLTSSDPFSNVTGTDINTNQTYTDNNWGSANYDIGHIFTTEDNGGVAGLRVVGVGGNKARGATGSSTPTGDAYWVDYVAHEMGHQFGGNHTFNVSAGGNRNSSTAYENGSGVSIMGYAGITGAANDVAAHSIPYFHSVSQDEILSYLDWTRPTVGTRTTNGNTIPTVTLPTGYTIPINTPFALTAVGSDPDGDTLTYSWENYDLGTTAIGLTTADNGDMPLFRNYAPSTSPTRMFPELSSILSGTNQTTAAADGQGGNASAIVERLPAVARAMDFRVVVRDNRAGGAGVNTNTNGDLNGATAKTVVLTVDSTGGGSFGLTSQNSSGISYAGGSNQTITWNVASTNAAPFNASNVNILLSIDGGQTFPTTLASNVANDGSEIVQMPFTTATSVARIKVVPTNNVFFDINNSNFTITFVNNLPPSTAPTGTPALAAGSDSGSPGDNLTNRDNSAPAKNLTFTVSGTTPGAAVQLFANGTAISGTVTAPAGGVTTITTNGSTTLAQGLRSITARQTTSGSAESANSPALGLTIDSIAPAVSAPDLDNNYDSGLSVSDNITASLLTSINGTAEANSTVQFFVDGSPTGSPITATGGTWQLSPPAFTFGTHTLSATATDPAGNVATSASTSITNDNLPPTTSNFSYTVVLNSSTGLMNLTYDDTLAGIIAANIGSGDLQVTGPNGYNESVTFVSADNASNGLSRRGTYSFPAPGGTWNYLDNGTYTVSVNGTQVADVAGNQTAAGVVDTIDVLFAIPQTGAPGKPVLTTDSGIAGDNLTRFNNTAGSTLSFNVGSTITGASVVLYADGVAISQPVVSPSGGVISITTDPGTFALTQGNHTFTARQTLGSQQQSNASASQVVAIDSVAPTAGSLVVPSIGAGGSTSSFTLNYADAVALLGGSFGNGDVRVTGPNSYSQLATFVTVDTAGDGTPRTVTYSLTAPGGSWDFGDNGTYTVTQVAGEVSDTAGNTAAAVAIDTFTVNFPGPFAYLSGNVLVINGTTSDDALGISVSGTDLVASLTGTGTLSFDSSSVASIQVNGFAGVDSFDFAGPIALPVDLQLGVGPSSLSISSGNFVFSGDASLANGDLTVNVATSASIEFASTQHLAALNLATSSIATMTPGSNVLVVKSLQIAGDAVPTATLELNDNDLVYNYSGPLGTKLSTLWSQILAGRGIANANGVFPMNGFGIRSSSGGLANAAAGFNKFALGAVNNADLGSGAFNNFSGEALAGSNLLVKYTYNGDTNLSGKIDFADYGNLAVSLAVPPASPTWLDGDFTGDGVVDSSDYSVIDFGKLTQGPQIL